MNRLQIIALVGFAALEACSAADDVAERPVDAGRDVKTVPRPDAQGADRLDASGGSDAGDASTPPPDPDDATPDAAPPPPDGAPPPPDGAPPPEVGPPSDRALPPVDALPPADVAIDSTTPSCLVAFTVNGVHWDAPEGGADAQTGARVVRLVGDAAVIGSWAPTSGLLLSESPPGTWSGTATFRDQQLTEFKFVKLDGITPEWESWTPFDSNRSLRVECFGDAGIVLDAADAASDVVTDGSADRATDADGAASDAGDSGSSDVASDASASADTGAADANADAKDSGAGDAPIVPVPARGKSYVGTFGARPPDATK